MRELRFVTPGDDAGHVVVESVPTIGGDAERFLLLLTDDLRAALRTEPTVEPAVETAVEPAAETAAETTARRPLPTPSPQPAPAGTAAGTAAVTAAETAAGSAAGTAEPAISPREIQVRVRAGEKPEEIAELFDADLKWVMRFAGPVLEERGRLTDEARRARARRSTADAQTVIFGETVDARFAAHGIDPVLVLWDSHRREDGQWVVSAHWVGGESERTAEWTFNLTARTVTAIDETASDLLSDRPIRPVFAEAPVTLTTAPPLTPGVFAFPAQPNAHTGPLPNRQQLFDQQRFDSGPRPVPPMMPVAAVVTELKQDAPDAPEEQAPEPVPAPPVREVHVRDWQVSESAQAELELGLELGLELDVDVVTEPDPGFDLPEEYVDEAPDDEPEEVYEETVRIPQVTNLGIAHREAPRPAETEGERAARTHIPSWDDILLGVRRKND